MQTPVNFEVNLQCRPEVVPFFDADTNTFSYVVRDPDSKSCAVVDSVLDIDYAAGRISTVSADRILDYIRQHGLSLEWIIETHVHADHLSAAPYLQDALGGKIGIGEHIVTVQETFGKVFNAGTDFARDGSQFDRLFADGDSYQVGSMTCHAMHTPGHTPACMVHVMGDAAFVGDTLFMPDGGTRAGRFPRRRCADPVPLHPARVVAAGRDTPVHCATTICPMGASWSTRPASPPSLLTTSMSTPASVRTTSCACARPGMQPSACRA